MPSSDEALQLEIFWIMYFGREDKGTGTLFNLTDGGDRGTLGFKWPTKRKSPPHTPEHIENWRQSRAGYTHSDETKAKIGAIHKGRPKTPEELKKLSDAQKGRDPSPGMTGKKHSEETKAKMREASKGKNKGKTPWNKGISTKGDK